VSPPDNNPVMLSKFPVAGCSKPLVAFSRLCTVFPRGSPARVLPPESHAEVSNVESLHDHRGGSCQAKTRESCIHQLPDQ
jgi:hypothetical protein